MLLIPGTSSVEHLRENLAVANLDLPADEGQRSAGALAGFVAALFAAPLAAQTATATAVRMVAV